MEHFRPLVISHLSAEDLEDIRLLFRMKVYAIASITGGASPGYNSKLTAYVDDEGTTNPKWNTRMDFRLHEPSLQNNRLYLTVTFYCSRTLGDKYVGGVSVPVKPLLDTFSANTMTNPPAVRYPVVRSSGGEQGFVNFSFSFGQPSPHHSGLQQPFPQRPRPPTTPQSTQHHAVLENQFVVSGQGQVSSGISPDPYGSTTEPVYNYSGAAQPQYYQPNYIAVSSDQNTYSSNGSGGYYNDVYGEDNDGDYGYGHYEDYCL